MLLIIFWYERKVDEETVKLYKINNWVWLKTNQRYNHLQHFFFYGSIDILFRSKLYALILYTPEAKTGRTRFLKLPFVLYFLYIICPAFSNIYISSWLLIQCLSHTLHLFRYKILLLALSSIFIPALDQLFFHLQDLPLCLWGKKQPLNGHVILPLHTKHLALLKSFNY